MRLIVMIVDSGAAQRALEMMLAQGLPAVLIWSDARVFSEGHATLLVGAHDRDVADVCASLASIGAVTESATQTLLPLTDPADLHIGRPALPPVGESSFYVLRVIRFEQLW